MWSQEYSFGLSDLGCLLVGRSWFSLVMCIAKIIVFERISTGWVIRKLIFYHSYTV